MADLSLALRLLNDTSEDLASVLIEEVQGSEVWVGRARVENFLDRIILVIADLQQQQAEEEGL
jgi:hypothetical protein